MYERKNVLSTLNDLALIENVTISVHDLMAMFDAMGEVMLRGELDGPTFDALCGSRMRYGFGLDRGLGEELLAPQGSQQIRRMMTWHGMLFRIRGYFANWYSWFVFSKQWLVSLRRLLHAVGPSDVIEVAAGNGHLGKLMHWRCTDIEPGNPWVEEMDAVEAVKSSGCKAVFMSWPQLGTEFDIEIANMGVPMIYVGEWGGCTGSDRFAEGADIVLASSIYPWFEDVPRWDGIMAYEGMMPQEENKS